MLAESRTITLQVNGSPASTDVMPHESLLEVLREHLGLTGTKEGCAHGDCGACVVLMDGKTVNACLVLALDADGHEILTVEGLAKGDQLHPLQQAFLEKGAVQCGFCTSGMILSAKALLDRQPDADADTIRRELSGVLCRCGTYPHVIEAVMEVGKQMHNRAGGTQ